MEDTYKKLSEKGHNTVDNLIKWMHDAKVLERTKDSEEKAAAMFNKVKDKTNVTFTEFKEVVTKTAAEKKKTAQHFFSELAEAAPRLVEALVAAKNAAAATLSEKRK